MCATLSEDKCETIYSYLLPMFAVIIPQYTFKAGLKKAKRKDKSAQEEVMHQS